MLPPSISIDPALYPPYYHSYPQAPQHSSLPPHYSSPSSQGSDALGTPTDFTYASSSTNINRKRLLSTMSGSVVNDSPLKRSKKNGESDAQSTGAKKDEAKAKPTRGSRACTVCRRLKMKCVGAEQGPPCKRCLAGNHDCVFEESNRGKRSSKKHELLTRSLRKMERTLDTVLRSIGKPSITSGILSRSLSPSVQASNTQALLTDSSSPSPSTTYYKLGSPKLHSLPDNTLNPLGLLAEASLANRCAHAAHPNIQAAGTTNSKPKLGVASDNYFKPGPMTILPLRRLYIERQIQPEMLSCVGTDEVVALFNIYFEHLNMHCNLLDRNFHTPSLVCSRSPFLLTTICSIASKFYMPKPDLHLRLTDIALKLAFSVPAAGYKSIEIIQAYLLLVLWGCGAVERYEQDKTWLLLGMAIRMATDLNLHRKAAGPSEDTVDGKARDYEVHNRERTWILSFCLDRSFSAQMGKPHSIKEDYIIRNTMQWCQSPVAIPTDRTLANYAELQRILSRSLEFLYSGTDTESGLQVHCDYILVIKTFEAQIMEWQHRCLAELDFEGQPMKAVEYKRLISRFYLNYAMLVLNSFGLQNAIERSPLDIGHFFARCHSSAIACALIVRNELGPGGFMRYSPDSHFVQTSYAVLSLLKLVRPEFQIFLENEQKTLALVNDVADVLGKISVNQHHTPALYSSFLRALISAKLEPSTAVSGIGKLQNHRDNHDNNKPQDDDDEGINDFEQHLPSYNCDQTFPKNFQFESEMGPVADITTFPPTMAPLPSEASRGALTMENILSSNFWDSMLVPGYNSMDGLSGGFVFGVGGSGLITPRFGASPMQSGSNSPSRPFVEIPGVLSQNYINAAFDSSLQGAIKMDP